MGKNALCIILASPTSESAENKFVIVVFLKYQGTIQVDCALGWPWFGWAASQLGAGGMGASFDITDDNPTHICPLPVFPTKLKAILTFAI